MFNKNNQQNVNQKLVKALAGALALVMLLGGCGKEEEKPQKKPTSSSKPDTSDSSDVSSVDSSSEDSVSSSENTNTSDDFSFNFDDTSSDFDSPDFDDEKEVVKDNSVDGSFVPADYKYVWGDEFSGTALDKTKWSLGNDIRPPEDVAFLDTPEVLKVADGLLQLKAIHYFDRYDQNPEFALPYAIRTYDTMNFRYGYVEMRARVPFQIGAFPSLWMKGNCALVPESELNLNYMVEVDIFENYATVDTLTSTMHKWYTNGSHSVTNYYTPEYTFSESENLSNEFHVYGFEWTEKEMSFYVDGEKYNTFDLSINFDMKDTMDGFQCPLYLIINNFMYTPKDGRSTENTVIDANYLPFSYDIDWIRVYQKDDEKSKLYLPQ